MALKGTTVIELTNVKTGEVERYEEHNLITKALEYMHQPIGALKSPAAITNDGYEPVYPSLLGGLVLWDSTIEESDTVIAQPHGVKMVGCASMYQVNTTTSPRRGSYNATESYFTNSSTEKSMKFVFDFTTSQANGTIKCVSLTNWKSGWNGFGGNEGGNDYQASRNNYDQYMGHDGSTSYWFNSSLSAPGRLFLIDPDNDVFYMLSSLSTSALTIAKRRANIHQKSVFRSQYHVHDLIENISITLPTTLSGANTYYCNYEPKSNLLYVYVSPSASSVASSGTFYVITVDMSTYTATVYTLTNKLGTTMYFQPRYMVCSDGRLHYMYESQYYVRSISLADSSYTSTYVGGWMCYENLCFLANEMIYFRVRKSINSSYYYAMAMYDPVAQTYEILGDYYWPYRMDNYRYHPVPLKGYPLFYYYFYTYSTNSDGSGSSTAYLWLNTKYLATINNLSREIEKTSDKTMKITYTIQEM